MGVSRIIKSETEQEGQSDAEYFKWESQRRTMFGQRITLATLLRIVHRGGWGRFLRIETGRPVRLL